MADDTSGKRSHRAVAQDVRAAGRFAMNLPIVGRVPIPRPDQLAFYGALFGLVAIEMVEWPVALAIGVGHALTSDRPESRDTTSEPE
ncbi:hypothetical protein A5757_01225 [Mycobacterium sp. 852013-51886_SCH5428379]|uniref:hypothetical protein n=1 Tax=Mycobacterium sp. 852013-51886_SCH5428379 TaxID=1834111 RepID=UPI0008006FBE|nr:hypothetical protein [Mycobacterium sp. 852013-51886_SCH5428379]OBB59074.1 hypothetical protein A5757_01225 [Mycobacterium sp. 852013-51886_SCH5428379]